MPQVIKVIGVVLLVILVAILLGYFYPVADTGHGYSKPKPSPVVNVTVPAIPTWFTSPEPAARG